MKRLIKYSFNFLSSQCILSYVTPLSPPPPHHPFSEYFLIQYSNMTMFYPGLIQSMYQVITFYQIYSSSHQTYLTGNNHLFTIFLMSNKSISSFVVSVLLGVIAMIVSDDHLWHVSVLYLSVICFVLMK